MCNWTEWVFIDNNNPILPDSFNNFGIYQIGMVNTSDRPIPIGRLAQIDKSGIIYIGRSGLDKKRTIAKRIKEFLRGNHSGGKRYARARQVLENGMIHKNHRLQARAKILLPNQILIAEANCLHEYFSTYAELPPCNASLPTNHDM